MQDQVQKALTLVGLVLDGKFTLTACIGIGGSGAVYRADQLALGRTVAVKVLNEDLCADPRMITRFRGEATSASSLNHPNCVSIIDYGRTPDGLLYLAMEYVKGPTLTQLVQNESPLATDRVVDIVCQALAGIEEAHLAGVVHADLKSDNIIVDQRRAGVDKVKIVDFGIARLVTGVREIEDRSISGTPEYMAPELISGAPPSFASDIYAVGIILYELLAQQTPFFAGTTTEILTAHLKSSPKQLTARRRDIPRELDAVISKALAKHPADRYASAAAMREALGAIRTRLLQLPVADSCLACGTSVAPTFKFCPECGTPRRRISRTLEVATVTEPSRVFPLPLTGRSDALGTLLEHLRGDPGPRRALLLVGREGAGRSTLLRAAYGELVAAGRVIYQVSPDPSGLASPFYPIRSLIAAILQLPAASSELELREAVLAMDLHERDVPAIAQLFGHPTTLLELEPAVRFRELVWSTLRALERAAAAGPIAIVCEDVDRFDVPSLEILRRAAGSAELALPAMVLTTTKAAAEQWPAATRLELGPLAEDSLAAMVRSLPATGEPPLPTAQQLLETTEGYPGHPRSGIG